MQGTACFSICIQQFKVHLIHAMYAPKDSGDSLHEGLRLEPGTALAVEGRERSGIMHVRSRLTDPADGCCSGFVQETYAYAKTLLDVATSSADGRPRALLVGGGIANFTDVAATFKGIIQVSSHTSVPNTTTSANACVSNRLRSSALMHERDHAESLCTYFGTISVVAMGLLEQ